MKVLKFGGSSVANADRIEKIIEIARSRQIKTGKVIVVVSALGGVTNQLEAIAQFALKGDDQYLSELSSLKNRHLEAIEELLPEMSDRLEINSFIDSIFAEIDNIGKGIALIEELTPKTRARLMSAGELLSSKIIAAACKSRGLHVKYLDSRELIETDDDFLNAKVHLEETNLKIQQAVDSPQTIFIAPGFISRAVDGSTTTLGRGGSDYTAALFAAAVKAEVLEIWTDVDGMLSADPRFVADAFTIDKMSYEEALELSYFGAKVIYPPTVQPVLGSGIPIYVKNTFNPDHPGTLISSEQAFNKHVVQGLSSIPEVTMITLSGSGMVGVPGIAHRFFRSLSDRSISVLFITQSSSEHTISIALKTVDADISKKAIEQEFEWELRQQKVEPVLVEKNMTLVAAVGDGMKNRVGIAGKLFSYLGENGVNVRAIAQGSTERNISFVIRDRDVVKALNTLHEGFFLSDRKVIHLFAVGVGNVGGTMFDQIIQQKEKLSEEYNLDVKLIGIANSRKMAFMPDGIDMRDWKKALDESSETFSPGEFIEITRRLNMRNSVFIDNTAAEMVSEMYLELLNSNVNVVASNKIAAASSYEKYQLLKQAAIDRNVKYLFETNVAAGLPVIKTIQDMILTGDKIYRIEAVLSGSLNFIFNTISEDVSFSQAVSQARELGYTEPDPSIDLSGVDVMRKILILARESDRKLEITDVKNESFLPEGSLDAHDWDELSGKLSECDEIVEDRRKRVVAVGKKLRYLASLKGDIAQVGLQEIGVEHPAFHLGGTDNIILIYTERYAKQPMVIKGAGAGPQVTASGVLSDIMRIANF